MDIDEETIRDRSTDAVFERGQNYRETGRIQRLDRFDENAFGAKYSPTPTPPTSKRSAGATISNVR